MTVLAAVACAALVAGLGFPPRRAAVERLWVTRPPAPGEDSAVSARRSRLRLAAAAVVLVAGPLAIGGAAGLVAGVVAATVVAVLRPSPDAPRVDPDGVALVVDLIAGCLAAGTGMAAALDAAAVAPGAQLQGLCQAVAIALRAGVPADDAWRPWLADPWLAPVARTAMRTAQTGAGAAADLRRTSVRLRARRRSTAQHRVRQASVWLVVPLGLCFLPAFVLVAVVPLVVGLLPSLR
jgi:Flp pilus assembly protein TadB